MRKIIDSLKIWYKGDDGDPEFNFVLEVYEYKRPPKRHWLAKAINKFANMTTSVWRSILKNPNIFITQLFALIALIISAITLYQANNVDDDKYERCTITNTNKDTVNIECGK